MPIAAHCQPIVFPSCTASRLQFKNILKNAAARCPPRTKEQQLRCPLFVKAGTHRGIGQDGLDLRRGCRNIEMENITGTTGDDLVALTAIPTGKRPAGRWGEHEFMGDSTDLADEDVYNISIKTVCGYSAGRCNIVRFLNTRGIKMYDII